MTGPRAEESFLLGRLNSLKDRIDERLTQLEGFHRDERVSEGLRQKVGQKMAELRQTKVEINHLIAALEDRVGRR